MREIDYKETAKENHRKCTEAYVEILKLEREIEKLELENDVLKMKNEALENSYINTEMNLQTLAEEKQQSGWIPVSERLPEKYCENSKLYNFQRVIATLENGCVCEVWWTGEGFRTAEKFKFIELTNNPVIAWQPLPEPYNPELLKEGE